MSLIDIARRLERTAIDNSPSLLTGLAVVGTVATAVLTARAAYRVGLDQNAGHYEPLLEGLPPENLSDKERAQKYWKEFIPPVVTGVGTVACIIGAHTVGSRRAAAVAAAYSLSEKAYTEYRDKVVEKIGEKKEQKVRDEIQQERVTAHPVSTSEVVITGNGDVMCYESLTGRYFMSSMETIKRAENEVNKEILSQDYASLSLFFDKLGLKATEFSEEVGWNTDNMLEVKFSSTISEDGRPCIAVYYQTNPIRKYFRVY